MPRARPGIRQEMRSSRAHRIARRLDGKSPGRQGQPERHLSPRRWQDFAHRLNSLHLFEIPAERVAIGIAPYRRRQRLCLVTVLVMSAGDIIQLPFLFDVLITHARTHPWHDNCCFAGRPFLKARASNACMILFLSLSFHWKDAVWSRAIRPRQNVRRDYRRSGFAPRFQ